MRSTLKLLLPFAVFCSVASAQSSDQSNGLPLGIGSNSEKTYSPTSSVCLTGDLRTSASAVGGILGGGDGFSNYDTKNLLSGGPYPDAFGWQQAIIKRNSPEERFLNSVNAGENAAVSRIDRPMVAESGSEMLFNPRLSDLGKAAYSNKASFQKLCGSSAVFKRNTGADVLVNVQISSSDNDSCRNALYSQRLSRNAWFQLEDIKNASLTSLKDSCSNLQITINVLQRGGDIDLIPTTLKAGEVSEANRVFATMTCDLNNIDNCVSTGKALTKYTYGFLSQLTQPEAVGAKGGPAVFNYVFKSYDQVLQ